LSNAKQTSQAGFSLVETVAAMGILALAAIPLLQISTDATRNAASLEARVLARTVAENTLARAMIEPETIDAGIVTGRETQKGRVFIWTRTSSLAQQGELQNLEVQVRQEEDEQVLARLVALKYIPATLQGTVQSNGEDAS
jgi:type II secretion system protein I